MRAMLPYLICFLVGAGVAEHFLSQPVTCVLAAPAQPPEDSADDEEPIYFQI